MLRWTVLVAFLACAAAAFVGYRLGIRQTSPIWISGQAHVSVQGHEATITARNWHYGINGSVAWYDPTGSLHERGWPSCLTDQTSTVRFEATQQTVNGMKIVLTVDCR